jgi:thymidylate synthase
MVLGFPADVAGFALLQMILAQKLGVAPGIYTHSISNAHIYDNHYDGAAELLARTSDHAPIHIQLPDNTFDRAEHKDPSVVEEIFTQFKDKYHPQDKIESITPSSIAV